LEKFKTVQFTISLQFFQIHQDMIFNLLGDDKKEMQLAEGEYDVPFVQNLSNHEISDVHAALQLLIDGDAKLHFSEHKCGRKVFLSHVIFVLDLVGRKGTRMTHSKLLMIDLAAAEKAGDAGFVNKSMSYLQQLVVSIINKETKHLPFRRSKMTYLLRDSICGNCRAACIANILPEKPNNRETISTCQFANDLGKVRNQGKVNTLEPPELCIEKLDAQLRILDAEGELQSELGGAIKMDGLTREEERQVAEQVHLFLMDEIDMIPLPSVCHIKAIFAEIKRRYTDIPNQVL
jgi:kinesin family protein 6/9